MHRRLAYRATLLVLIVFALLAWVALRPAFAQGKAVEAQARALQKKAMDEDYLTVDFDKALEKLNSAIAKCGGDKCSAVLRAQLRRDVATVQSAANKKGEALTALTEALKIDPNIQLDPNFKTKELEAVFAEAKKTAGGGGASGGGTSGGGSSPAGDFTHTPITEQLARTPVPVYVEYAGSEAITKVLVKYKGFGMTEFKIVELKQLDKGWGGTIPCIDVMQGDMQYYVQGFNAGGDPVATAGDRNNTYKVPIKRDKIAGEPPHLPGQPPPTQCADAGDCPPDFPGCKKGGTETPVVGTGTEPTLKGEGDECEEDAECTSGSCKNKQCAPGDEKPKTAKRRRIWIGISGVMDYVFLPSGDDVCRIDPQTAQVGSAGYYCTNSDGSNYPLRPSDGDTAGAQAKSIVPGTDDKVSGGGALGNIRVMLTADYALNDNIMVGVRFGYVINRYPGTAAANDGKTFAPIHLEARGTYVIGKEALSKAGFAPYVFLGAGASEFDGKVDVSVKEQSSSGRVSKTVQAWAIGGPLFIGIGGGARYAFTPRFAGMAGLRVMGAIGGAAGFLLVPAPELGVQMGF